MTLFRLAIALVIALYVTPAVSAASTVKFVLPSGIQVEMRQENFDKSKFKIEGCDAEKYCFIDGQIPYGTTWGLPTTVLQSITITDRGRSYQLDSSDMYNALQGKSRTPAFGGYCNEDACLFRGVFSDATGSFAAEWTIVNGRVFRNLLTDDKDVVHAFLDHIEPQTYDN